MYRVLLVDDEAPFVEGLTRIAWNTHCCGLVGTASNGEEALLKFNALAPDIIITDIAMPLMNGITLIERVLSTHPNMQFILMTVHKSFDYALQAIQAGAVDYVVKDMHLRENLIAALDKAVKRLALLQGQPASTGRTDILRLDSRTDPRLHLPLLVPLLERFGGTLAALRVSPAMPSEDELESLIRVSCKTLFLRARCILWGSACFELLMACCPSNCRDVLMSLQQEAQAVLAPAQVLSAVYAPLESTEGGYLLAHDAAIAALDLMFYHPQPYAVPVGSRRCTALPKAYVEEWIIALHAMRTNRDGIAAYIDGPLEESARFEQFMPAMLKQAYLRILHSYEMRYAENAQLDARKAIIDAPNLAALTEALLSGISAVMPGSGAYSYAVTAALKYLGEHFVEVDLQLGAVADYVCISPGYLSRRLKEETGKSFQELLMQMRMESAADLLRHTPDKVYVVAEKVGYQNYRTFVKAFVNYYNVSPKKFR